MQHETPIKELLNTALRDARTVIASHSDVTVRQGKNTDRSILFKR